MKQTCVSCFIALMLIATATADDKIQAEEESPRLSVAVQLSVKTYDPSKPAGTLSCIVHNRTTEEVRLPAEYDGRTLIIYGGGKTHRGRSNLWRPNRKTEARPRFVTIDPGKKETIFEVSLKDILTPQIDRTKARKWAWDWRYRFEPPSTPIHGWRRDGFVESASFFAELRIVDDVVQSEPVVLAVKVAREVNSPDGR